LLSSPDVNTEGMTTNTGSVQPGEMGNTSFLRHR
jgi:hypothetical protein